MTRGTLIKFGIPVLILAAIAVAVVTMLPGVAPPGVGADHHYPTIPTWPQFSMEYETDGPAVSVGPGPAEVLREVRRLEFGSMTQWTDTVTTAPTIETRVGQFSRVGSYKRLDGTTFTEYDAMSGTTQEEEIEDGTVVGPFMQPFPIEESGYEFTPTTTEAAVCFTGECQENAEGLLYVKESGTEMVFVRDARGIPLRIGEGFVVREIRINDAQQPVEIDEQRDDNEDQEPDDE